MKVKMIRFLLSFFSTDDNTQNCYFHTLCFSETVKQQIDFRFKKMNQWLFTDKYFSHRQG